MGAMPIRAPILLLAAALLLPGLAHAQGQAGNPIQQREFASQTEEDRYRALLEELRCTVCQNQSLADSDAPLAQDLRREVYGQIRAGRSDFEIRQFMRDRYGDFVLYNPPLAGHTLLLWVGPPALLLIALAAAAVVVVRRRRLLTQSRRPDDSPKES